MKDKTNKDGFSAAESILIEEGFFVNTQAEARIPALDDMAVSEEAEVISPSEVKSLIEQRLAAEDSSAVSVHPEKLDFQYIPSSKTRDLYDIPTIISYLKWHMNRISEKVIGRGDIIQQIIYSILTGEHLLLLSRSGMAKSYLANNVFSIFSNSRVFSAQASKDQTPDNYFGPYNIEEFKKGRIRHNIVGSIIEANFVLLDEFFDASDVVLRSLLSVLNERKFNNGPEQIDVAIHTAIATANYMRLNEVTEAVLDRFMYKAIIPEDKDMYNQLLIDHAYSTNKGKVSDPPRKISFNQIIYISDIVRNHSKDVKIITPELISFLKNVIINRFVSEMRKFDSNFFISPRKQAKIGDFLRASAVLDGRNEANMNDLRNMYFALTTLNSYVSVKQKDRSERDMFLDVYEQTMSHFKAAGAFQQIEFLANIRSIFQAVREDPEKKEKLLRSKGLLQGVKKLISKLFPSVSISEDDAMTIESLKKSLFDLNPGVDEVRELKQGILKDYKDLT